MSEQAISKAAADVLAERKRQVESEGWSEAHDDQHTRGEMAFAAAAYCSVGAQVDGKVKARNGDWLNFGWASTWRLLWPWSLDWWKPTDHRRNLVKAGALILAEIERIDRLAAQEGE